MRSRARLAKAKYTLSGCTLIEYWYCTAGPGGNCYPFGDNAIDKNGAALPGRAFPSGNWCFELGKESNDGHNCAAPGGYTSSYVDFQSYCASWDSNKASGFNGGIGQCPAATCCH